VSESTRFRFASLRLSPSFGADTSMFRRLWHHLPAKRRRQFGFLLLLMLAASLAEALTIGAVLPFLAVLTAPDRVFNHPLMQGFVQHLELTEPAQLLVPITVLFALFFVLASGIRLVTLWATTRVSYATGAELGLEIYRRTLYQPYQVHLERNTSEIIDGITEKTHTIIVGTLYPLLNGLASFLMLAIVLAALLMFEPLVALATFGGFGLIYLCIVRFIRARLLLNSKHVAHDSTQRIRALQEGLGGIRDLLIDGSQPAYTQIYGQADSRLRKAQAENSFISSSPRLLMEAIAIVLTAGLALTLALQPGGIGRAIPILGALALGAQRLLPMLQQVYHSWATIKGHERSALAALRLLDQPLPAYAGQPRPAPLAFSHCIRFDDVWFRYGAQGPWVLKGVNLEVPRGSRVGVVGMTGNGKSTLLDVLMGLLAPTQGRLMVDGVAVDESNRRAWQAHVAHVPQSIFLADASIAENIAFGVPSDQIDVARVHRAAAQAQMAQTIEAWDEGYQTMVGERGVRLSGGQRQRIGIARALYKQADVLIFDEATSALDTETERLVMNSLDGLDRDLTIFIIAHRLSTLSGCTRIVELNGGSLRTVKETVQDA
jgi:ATP-binding cassette, subfamily B, bacterial PglK